MLRQLARLFGGRAQPAKRLKTIEELKRERDRLMDEIRESGMTEHEQKYAAKYTNQRFREGVKRNVDASL